MAATTRRSIQKRRARLLAAVLANVTIQACAQDQLPTVEIRPSALLPGLGEPLGTVPANVQLARGHELERSQQDNLAEYLARTATSVTLNSSQGNQYQPDLNFRGFTASPLLGVPQGLSVYQDGGRINEPFGDAVNWDLLPTSAIAAVELVPGSNPVYGLNTLGGTLSVATWSGRTHPGSAVVLGAGDVGRKSITATTGGASGDLDYFVTGNATDDPGWAQHNASRLRQLFGKLGYRTRGGRIEATLTGASNQLAGAQTIPLSFADKPREAYTYPDLNRNRLVFATAHVDQSLDERLSLAFGLYYRRFHNRNYSSNVNDGFGLPDDNGGIATTQAFNDRATIAQDSFGISLQASLTAPVLGRPNELVLGASLDAGRAAYAQDTQPAVFTADRGTVGMGEFERITNASTRNRYSGIYLADTWTASEHWMFSLSGRFNAARLNIRDIGGDAPQLNGDHRFTGLNPAAGIIFRPRGRLSAYASYNQATRTPTPMELTCANPDAPCKLPNAFLADPPLRQVLARTVEAGVRTTGGTLDWTAAAYRSKLDDDIQFVSTGGMTSNAGYFHNVGRTRRQGIELSGSGHWQRWHLSASYGLVDATFQTAFKVNSPVNTHADDAGSIEVRPGDRIPAIARSTLKFAARYAAEPWELGMDANIASCTFARGDENNIDARGTIPGYGLVNLNLRYSTPGGWEWFARVDNLFDRQYANLGVLGMNAFPTPGRSFDGLHAVGEQFRSVGTPRAFVAGLRRRWR